MKTVVYYFSATGNSLYVAKFLQDALGDAELHSIPEELFHGSFDAAADCVGFVFPMHCMGLPMQVESFMERLTIADNPYIFAIATCGAPYIGLPFADAEAILAARGQRLCASCTSGWSRIICRSGIFPLNGASISGRGWRNGS